MSSNSSTPGVVPENTDDIESQTTGLYTNLVVGSITIVISLLLFEFFRRKVPSIFEARRILNENRKPLDYHNNRVFSPASPSYKPLGWLHPVLHLDIDTIAKTHGLDTALFLRYLRAMAFLFFILLIPTVPLLPIYYTGEANDNLEEGSEKVKGVQLFALSNVHKDDSWRFWVTLASDYVVLILVLTVVYREFKLFAKYRIQYRASKNPANYAILVEDIPKSCASESVVQGYWNRLFPGMIERVFIIRNAKKLDEVKDQFWTSVSNREVAEWNNAYKHNLKGERPTHKIGMIPWKRLSVDSINYWEEEQNKHYVKLSTYQANIDVSVAPVTRAAIVVFSSKRVASVAAQTNFASKENEWRVHRAPEPKAMNWGSFGIPWYQVGIRNTITIVCTLAMTIFWVIPITFIMSLTNLTKLVYLEIRDQQPFLWLEGILDLPDFVLNNLQSFLPAIVLSVFLSLVPTFIRIFVNVSRVPSNAEVDIRVRDWYFNFVVFSNFLFVIVSGSLLNQINEIVNEPSKLANFLAESAPRQGAFIMNFILLKGISETPLEILQIGRVVVRWVMLKFLARTKRQRDAATVGNTQFQFFRYYAISQLIALLGLIYSTISPFIIPCCLVYFIMMYIVWKYNLSFALYNQYEDGGMMYGGALYGTWIGLFLHLVTMIGIFGVNKNPAQSVLIIIPTAVSLAFFKMLRSSFPRIVHHGSTLETLKRIEEAEETDEIPEELVETFVHPSFVPLPEPIENLNGVEQGKDPSDFDVEKGTPAGTDKRSDGNNEQDDNDAGGDKEEDVGGKRFFQSEGTKSKSSEQEQWVDAEDGDNNATPPKR